MKCRECGGTDLSWACTTRNIGGAGDGRLRLSEIDVMFYLGCNECSETISFLTLDEVVAEMNKESFW